MLMKILFLDAKEQVLANLANFAYDPVNYDYLWRLKILEVFFSALHEKSKKLVIFGISGICNICLGNIFHSTFNYLNRLNIIQKTKIIIFFSEPLSRKYIIEHNGIKIISSLLSRAEEPVILSAITTLIYLDDPNSPEIRQAIASPENVELMSKCTKSSNVRIKNLASVFLQDLCGIKISESQVTPETSTSTNPVILESTGEPTSQSSSAHEAKDTKTAKDAKAPRIVMNLQ